jgi:hypothetical protein
LPVTKRELSQRTSISKPNFWHKRTAGSLSVKTFSSSRVRFNHRSANSTTAFIKALPMPLPCQSSRTAMPMEAA